MECIIILPLIIQVVLGGNLDYDSFLDIGVAIDKLRDFEIKKDVPKLNSNEGIINDPFR